MADRTAKELIDIAKGDFSTGRLTDTSGLGGKYLYTQPIIEYLQTDEIPHYSSQLRGSRHKVKNPYTDKNKTSEKNLFNFDDDIGRSYFVITDRRIIYIMGHGSGDQVFDLPYSLIQDYKTKEAREGYIEITDNQGYTYRSEATVTDGAGDYISEKISKFENKTVIPDGVFYITARSSRTGSPINDYPDGVCLATIDDDGIAIKNQNEGLNIAYNDIVSARLIKRKKLNLPKINGCDYISVTLPRPEMDDRIHVYMITNMRNGSGWGGFYNNVRYLTLDGAYSNIQSSMGERDDKSEWYVPNEWAEYSAKLKIQEWDDRTVSTGPDLEGKLKSKGKSKGFQIGPFSRGKTKSEADIQLSDKSMPDIDQGAYTASIDAFIVYGNGIVVESDPRIDILYSDIEQVMLNSDGLSIRSDQLTYTISGIDRSEDYLKNLVDEIKGGINDEPDNERTQSETPTEKIREIKSLYDDGILSEKEFNEKKNELLDDI